jgi:GT2 family glycosyltransferase/glycosyltransferase involved in cell wall biosynthesis
VIVLNYNGVDHLENCFSSLGRVAYPADRLELILMDNHSSDQSVEFTEKHFPLVRIIRGEQNFGFAGGNNRAAALAQGTYVVFLNNDMTVKEHFVQGLVDTVQTNPEIACAGAMILNWDGSRFDFGGSAADFAGHAFQTGYGRPAAPGLYDQPHPTLYACGGAMIVDRQIFLEVGGFDENYFIYYEDLDLGWRLWLLGYQVYYAPQAVAYHRHHGTMSGFSDFRKSVLYKRNTLATVIKNYDDRNLGRILPAVLLGTVDGFIQTAVRAKQLDLGDFDIKQGGGPGRPARAFSKENVSTLVALHEVAGQLPQVMKKRAWIQSRRRRSDAELAPLFSRPFRYWPDLDLRTQLSIAEPFQIQELFRTVPRRILVISSDILPYPGFPTVGSGLRAWGLGWGLKSRGHEVLWAMPRAALTEERRKLVGPEIIDLAWDPETLPLVIQGCDPDLIVVCNWPVLNLLPSGLIDVPIILDQHGPHFLERSFQHFGQSEDNARRKLNALAKADFFTCAGRKQLDYFQTWLEQAGWAEEDLKKRCAFIPVSLSPQLPERKAEITDDPVFVYGGVFLPWQDPSDGLTALIEGLERENAGRLDFYGGKHPVYPVDPGLFESLRRKIEVSRRVVIKGLVSHDQLLDDYSRAHLAIDLMKKNPERELAFTTRTVEYLWCGLPVIYQDYAELSDYIREYRAGWLVDPEDPQAVAALVRHILKNPAEIAERSENAQRLVRERLTWDLTIDPLDHFVRWPTVRSGALREFPPGNTGNHPLSPKHLWRKTRYHLQRQGFSTLPYKAWAYLQRQWTRKVR